ncbi:MAG: beta-ketoacyl-[acyl-carrier-protein] synthase family protein [Elusimicrobiota bacterium]|jgi:3-oxoacyl-[acyl-carrier-protein] synthase II|nr:beta-ketoacyl-[acyl-carrier-protein] synthase family protein [Elusimicrobiota bacterium]
MEKRIVISGVGSISPYGAGANLLSENMLALKSGIAFNETLSEIPDMPSHISSKVPDIDFSYIPRQFRRSMSNMSLYAYGAAVEALESAKVSDMDGVALFLGSTISSMQTWMDFAGKYAAKEFNEVKTNVVFKVMNHSPLTNLAQSLGISGLGLGASAACATGLMNIGIGYSALKHGLISKALCGGTDEYHPIMTACFSIMNAASSHFNDSPSRASRPFDAKRDGIVCSEGAGMVFIEPLEDAVKRNAHIYGEIIGFGTNIDTKSISHPSRARISQCMELAISDAKIKAAEIDFINAHATSTVAGDIEEAKAIEMVFGKAPFVNSLKGHIGHTMAASGSLELIATLDMMEKGKFAPTLNLDNVDPACGDIKLFSKPTELKVRTFMKNSFALGGTNCCLIVRRY